MRRLAIVLALLLLGVPAWAAVAHDAATESLTFTTTTPFDFTHTPSGTPRGVLVFIYHGTVSADLITSVTYGGVTMTREQSATDTATEPGRSYVYFLGASVPTGIQTVRINHTATSTVKIATVVTLTSAAVDLEVHVSAVINENAANPQIALDSQLNDALRYCAIYSGTAAPGNLVILGGMTAVTDHDFGAFVGRVDRQTTPSSGSFTIGYTAVADDVAMVALAVREPEAGVTRRVISIQGGR